jgi:aflatoxin B1 aldehyde reductase
LEETLAGIDDLYRAGTFDRFGLSNFTAAEVEETIRIAKEKNYIVPSVYQGNYNAVARRTETELFPILREHGMAFYAYSPIAGGFLTKTRAALSQSSEIEGRWSRETAFGQLYHALYNKPRLLEALDMWNDISETTKIPRAELAYRWIVYHSHLDGKYGDAVVIGASRIMQLEQTLAGLRRGPLPEAAWKRIADIWEIVKHESILDSYDTLRLSN